MTPPIDSAIALLEFEISKLGKPDAHTSLWFVLRAKSTGLSLLRAMKQAGVADDPLTAEAFRKEVRESLMDMGAAQQ